MSASSLAAACCLLGLNQAALPLPKPAPADLPAPGMSESLAMPTLELPDCRVRLVPKVGIETIPQLAVGPVEFGATRPDVRVRYRVEKQKVVTVKPRMIERTVQVLTRRTIACGETDPTTGMPATEARIVEVPMPVTTRCMVLEEVAEEVLVRVPEVSTVESPVVVRRYGALAWEKPVVARRFEARLFTDPLALPPCEKGPDAADPLGRPESPSPGAR
jgi:hypothetical protein